MTIRNQKALDARAASLTTLNGIRMVLVDILTNEAKALLQVHFYNSHALGDIINDIDTGGRSPESVFPITGGHRIRAGRLEGQVRVEKVEWPDHNENVFHLTVAPIGDYSTYTLSVNYEDEIDPVFGEIDFKFRPGCFNNCEPDWDPSPPVKPDPPIDYLAKDYDSFRHTLMTWMGKQVPDWQPTSEADLDQVLLELFSAAADELSDYQDRVMNEAYLGTARKRVSLARHARLMDYHIHQGCQADTWMVLKVDSEISFAVRDETPSNKGFPITTAKEVEDASTVVFFVRCEPFIPGFHKDQEKHTLHPLLNEMRLYTWEDTVPALAAGSVVADITGAGWGQVQAEKVQNLIREGTVRHLLIQQYLNPRTGKTQGLDPTKRQLLRLIPGEDGAKAGMDPKTAAWYVHVRWEEKDKLKSNYCFVIDCPHENNVIEKVSDVCMFHGNLAQAYHGRPRTVIFREKGEQLAIPVNPGDPEERHYERIRKKFKPDKEEVICKLPEEPLAYKRVEPGGEMAPVSTLNVWVEIDGEDEDWTEIISMVSVDGSDERGKRFVVETDENRRSLIRFGNGINGKTLPKGAVVHCSYQVGRGLDGNIGADTLIYCNEQKITACWNPFDVKNGFAPEPAAEIIRRAPEAYRIRQLRAVTDQDYVDRAEELPQVSKAAARYMWTGSWRTVRIAIDPVGTTELSDELREKVSRHLEAVRLIGEDLEIRSPRFVPLDIDVIVCVHSDFWPEDVKFLLEQEFSEGYTPDGDPGFFHPDMWTFGQHLRKSQIVGRVQSVKGVDSVKEVSMKRWNMPTPEEPDIIKVWVNEIIRVRNDPDHREEGMIRFDMRGGRR